MLSMASHSAGLIVGGFSLARQFSPFLASPPPAFFSSPKLAASREVVCLLDAGALPLSIFQASCDAHLQAACSLRVCTFNAFPQTYRIEEHRRFLSAVEFEALKEKVEGKRPGFGKVICVIATVSLQHANFEKDSLPNCKVTRQINGLYEDCVVVGSLDLNQTPKLPDEMSGCRPAGVEGQHRRGYLSNVCVSKVVQRNGVGTNLIKHARMLALAQGISDLYTHVAVDNESAKRLYEKSGFVVEKVEKRADARLMGRPPHLLLWMGLSNAPKG